MLSRASWVFGAASCAAAVAVVACGDLKGAPVAPAPDDPVSTITPTEPGPAAPAPSNTSDAAPTPAVDASSDAGDAGPIDAGDPCETIAADAGAIDPEWAAGPLAPAHPTAANYTVHDGVVCDRTTKLTWERAVGPARTWNDAKTYCDTLSLGGHTDWRLPTRIELLGIVDYASAPALEPTAFPTNLVAAALDGGGAETRYWAATPHPQLFLRRYVVSFELGQAYTAPVDADLAVRCVRGGLPGTRTDGITYVATGHTALDPRTGLRWQRGEVGTHALTWSEALAACQALELDGFHGFRLPTIRELESLYDVRAATGPLWDKAAFSAPNATIAMAQLWSANEAGDAALVLSFIPNESMFPIDKGDYAGARCVAGP